MMRPTRLSAKTPKPFAAADNFRDFLQLERRQQVEALLRPMA
jgi:hypothetical protein